MLLNCKHVIPIMLLICMALKLLSNRVKQLASCHDQWKKYFKNEKKKLFFKKIETLKRKIFYTF